MLPRGGRGPQCRGTDGIRAIRSIISVVLLFVFPSPGTESSACESDDSKAAAWRRRTGIGVMKKDQPNPRRAFSSHFGTFTPFTMSHRQSDNSPVKASTKMGKIVPA